MLFRSRLPDDVDHGDHHWLTDIVKGELGFDGFIVSDWQAVDQVDPDYATAVARSINAGIDMVMVPSDYGTFQRVLTTAVENGQVAQSRIDDAVARILRVKLEMGLFEHPMPALQAALVEIGRASCRERVFRTV